MNNKGNSWRGSVDRVFTKSWGNKVLYSFKVDNNDSLFMCGENNPNLNKGDIVEFSYDTNPRGQTLVRTVNKVGSAPTPSVFVPGGKGVSKDDYWKKKEEEDKRKQPVIEWQNARTAAISTVGMLVAAGALKLPTKEADRMEPLLALVDELTAKYADKTRQLYVGEDTPEPAQEPVAAEAEEWE